MSNRFVERITNQVVSSTSSTARAVHLPETILPVEDGVAVFTDQAPFELPQGTTRLTYWVAYTPNAALVATNQRVLLVPYWGDGVNEMNDACTDSGVFPSTGSQASLTLFQTTFTMNATNPGDPVLTLVMAMDVPAGAVTCRLLAKQQTNDDLNYPGSISIYVTTAT